METEKTERLTLPTQ